MPIESSTEDTRRLLEELKGRISGFARQENLKAEVLDGLTRALDMLAAIPETGQPRSEYGIGELSSLHRTLQARTRSNQAMISATDELQYLESVCRIVVEDCGHAMVWVGYAGDDAGKTVRPVTHYGFDEGYLETLNITWEDSERGRGPTGTAIRRGRPCVCSDMQQDAEFAPWREEAVKRGYASSVVLPLMHDGRAFGAINIYSREPDAFSPEEVALLSELAQDLSFGIHAIRLRQAHAQSEELLRRSEERFRSIVELSPDAVFVNHNDRISYVNHAALELFGAAEAGELLGRSPFGLFHPEYHAKMRERIAALFSGGTVPLTETRIVRLDGTVREVEVAASLYDVQEGRAIQVVIRDITERKRAEELLARERANLQALFDVANFGMLLLDGYGAVKRVNETLVRWIGSGLSARGGGQPGDVVGCIHAIANPAGCGRTDHCSSCAIRGAFESVLRGGEPVHQVETEAAILVNGKELRLWLEISADPLELDGQPHVLLGMANITDRKQAAEALQREKNRLDAVMAALPVGMAITDERGGTIQANGMFDQIWGGVRPPTSTVDDYAAYQAWWADSGLPVQPGEWASARAIGQGETVVGQLMEIQRFDGSRAFVINSASPIRDADGNVVGSAVAIQDITQLRAAQQALRDGEERLRLAVEAGCLATWDWHVSTGEVLWNDEHYRMLGYAVGEVKPSYPAWAARLHPDDLAATEAELRRSMVQGADYAVQFRVLWPDGDIHWMESLGRTERDADGHPVRNYGVMLDITERKRAEEALRESREDLNRAQAVAHMGSWRLNVRKNELLWSEENWRIFGVPQGTPLTYEVFLGIAHPDDRAYVDERWSAALRGEPYDIEHRIVVDGRIKWVRERAELEFDGEGQLLGGFGTTEDITERKQVEGVQAFLAQTGAGARDEPFFDVLSRYLGQSLGMDFVCIDRLEGDGLTAQTVSVWQDGHFDDNVTYALKDTPCGELVGKSICCFPAGVARIFPHDKILQKLCAESYVGVTLWGHAGQPIGLIAVIGREPLANRALAEATLRLVSVRAAGELERLDAEAALRESEARLRTLGDNLPEGAIYRYVQDRNDRPHFEFISAGIEHIVGVAPGEIMQDAAALYDTILPELRESLVAEEKASRERLAPFEIEVQQRHRGTGELRWSLLRSMPHRRADGTTVWDGIQLDVTERRKAQEAMRLAQEDLERRVNERTAELLEANEALQKEIEARKRAKEVAYRLAAIVSSSDDAIFSNTPDGVILTWNKGAERLLGYREPEVLGRHVSFVAPPDRPDEPREILDRIQRGERVERFETVLMSKDGSRVDVSLTISPIIDPAGRVIGASIIAHDITDRKRMEDELRQASEYARSLIEASLDPLVTIGLSGEITDVNRAMERMTGVTRAQLIGSRYLEYVTEPERAVEVYARVQSDGSLKDYPLTIRHLSGATTDVLFNAALYRDPSGVTKGMFTAARDITQRKRAEEELARYREHLEDLVRQRTAELEIAYNHLREDIAARERLEEERQRLIDILEATPDMVSYSDASGKVLYFNQAARKILGIPPGVDLAEITIPAGHPDWANRLLQEVAIPTAVLEGLWSGETAVLDAEGREIPVSQVIIAHRDATGQVAYFSTIARDMTPQKRAERDLKVLASFPSENPSPVLRTTEDGLLLYANESAAPLLEAWGCAVGDHVPPQVQRDVSRAIARGKIQEADHEAAGRFYSVLFAPIHETGNVNLYGRDITERRQIEEALVRARDELEQRVEDRTAELLQVNVALVNKIEEHARTVEALRNSQMRLAEAQRIAHLGGWEWDVRTGALIWSEEVYRIFGLSPRDRAPAFAEFLRWLPAEDRKQVERTAFLSVAQKAPFSLDHRIVLAGGEIRHVHAQAEMVLGPDGEPLRMIGTIMDITDRVRAEEEARIRQQQLIQADKMVSLGILVAGVAHEINNPNHSIMSNVTALAGVWESTQPILDRFYEDFGDFVLGGFEYSECRDKLPEMFSNALANSKRIEVIVTELRDFARHSPKENMAPVDVNAVVKSATILMGNMLKKSTDHFSASYGRDLPPVLGNFQRIEQVVINLIQNACQALACRDRAVMVSTSHDPVSDSVLIEVCDEGMGIPEENIKQLGTPFFTTKRGSEGMGLGLWISSNIVHEHGGVLTFSAREGGGTRATLALPAKGGTVMDASAEYGK